MVKKVSIVLIILFSIGIIISLLMKKEYTNLEWAYQLEKSEHVEYLQEKNNILIVTTTNEKHSYINIIDKSRGNQLAKISINPVKYEPVIKGENLFVASKKPKGSKTGDLYVIDLNNGDLILKEQYSGRKWPFIVEGSSLFFVDVAGTLRNIQYESKEVLWKILSDNSFIDSTKPSISNNKFFICNNNQILALDLKTSEIMYNFKADSNILSCSFDTNTAIVSMQNDYIYAIDLLLSRVKWKYKFVSLYSKMFLETINNKYLLILNIVDFGSLVETKRAKILSDTSQILYVLDIDTGRTKWQKPFEEDQKPFSLSQVASNSTILLQSIDKKLGAYFLDNGLMQWQFFSKDEKSVINYSLRYDKVVLIMHYTKNSKVYLLSLDDGSLLGQFIVPKKITLDLILLLMIKISIFYIKTTR